MLSPAWLDGKSAVGRLRTAMTLLVFSAVLGSCGEGASGPTDIPTPPPPPPAPPPPPPSGDLTVVKISGDRCLKAAGR